MFHPTFVRTRSLLLLAVGAMVGFAAPAYANQTQVKYTLSPGQTSTLIAIPGFNTPVTMTCVQNTVGFRGVGQSTILRVQPQAFLEWVGNDIANGGTVSTGFSATAGTHIIYCDFSKLVDLQVGSAFQIRLKNTSSSTTMTGVINFVW